MDTYKSYITFEAEVDNNGRCYYKIINMITQIRLGILVKQRIGSWESWCLYLEENCYLSASCIDEVRERIRQLNYNKLRAI